MKQMIDCCPYSGGQPDGSPVNWPCFWIKKGGGLKPPFVVAFHKEFALDAAETLRVHAGADERYELYLDGEWIGRGSERGDAKHWFFDTYDLELGAGAHVLVAKVWAGRRTERLHDQCRGGHPAQDLAAHRQPLHPQLRAGAALSPKRAR